MTLKQLCFSFKGRIDRPLYWVYAILSLMSFFCIAAVLGSVEGSLGGIIAIVLFLTVIFVEIAITIKRLHDTNRSGWCILISLIPIIGGIYLLVVCGFLKGTEGDNDYGPAVYKIT